MKQVININCLTEPTIFLHYVLNPETNPLINIFSLLIVDSSGKNNINQHCKLPATNHPHLFVQHKLFRSSIVILLFNIIRPSSGFHLLYLEIQLTHRWHTYITLFFIEYYICVLSVCHQCDISVSSLSRWKRDVIDVISRNRYIPEIKVPDDRCCKNQEGQEYSWSMGIFF